MNTKKIILTSASVSMVCTAILLTQSVLTDWAKASTTTTNDVLQRIEDLEVAQDDNDKAFFLIDTSLNDLDARVLELEKRADARTGRVNALAKRTAALRAAIRKGK